MNAEQFCNEYVELVETLEPIVDPKVYRAMHVLYMSDPHDLIEPTAYFSGRAHAVGFIVGLLLEEIKRPGTIYCPQYSTDRK